MVANKFEAGSNLSATSFEHVCNQDSVMEFGLNTRSITQQMTLLSTLISLQINSSRTGKTKLQDSRRVYRAVRICMSNVHPIVSRNSNVVANYNLIMASIHV